TYYTIVGAGLNMNFGF
ncbi:Chemokine binding protein, partial [Monkeypox virus]